MRDFSEINHVVSQNARTPLGQIRVSGCITNSIGVPSHPMRVFGSYAIVYLLEGGGLYQDGNGYSTKARPGDILLLFPEIPHSYGPGAGECWNEFYTVFDGPVFDLWREVGLLDPARPVRHLEPVASWLSRLQNAVMDVWYAEPVVRALELSRFLSLLMEVLAADVPDVAEPAARNWLDYARFLLEADLDKPMDLEQVARRTGVSYESFRKRFQHQTGVSPAHYRMARRIEVASDLLRHTSMTNQQVAECVGFSDEYYFYKRFKQFAGKTPRAFRRDSPGH